jgi:hypothetical protein
MHSLEWLVGEIGSGQRHAYRLVSREASRWKDLFFLGSWPGTAARTSTQRQNDDYPLLARAGSDGCRH